MKKIKEMQLRTELVQEEELLRTRYKNTLEQSAKIGRYNREIQETLEQLFNRFKEQDSAPMTQMASGYLKRLEEQYHELTVSKYCEDYLIDRFLVSCTESFEKLGWKTMVLFQNYQTPSGIFSYEVEEVLRWMVDGLILDHSEDQSVDKVARENLYPEAKPCLILQGGFTGKELILACEVRDIPGNLFPEKEVKKISKLLKRINADLDVEKEENVMKMIAGIPV